MMLQGRQVALLVLLLSLTVATMYPWGLTQTSAGARDPDYAGIEMIFVRDHSLWVKRESGQERALTRGYTDGNPVISPDGRTVAFERLSQEKEAGHRRRQIWILDPRTKRQKRVLYAPGDCRSPAFDHSGLQLYFEHSWNYRRLGSGPHLLTRWTETISVVAISNGRWRDLSPLTKEVVEYEGRQYPFPRVSCDAHWIMWSPMPHEGGLAYIYRAKKDGRGKVAISGPRTLQGATYGYYFPVPYDTSGTIACLRGGGELGGVALIDEEGKEIWHREVPRLVEYDYPLAVSTNGTLAFSRRDSRPEETSIWILPRDASSPQLYLTNATHAAWSPLARQ